MTAQDQQSRAEFEAHMLKLSPCTRLHRHTCDGGDKYRTVTVQRNWELWQAARALPAGVEPVARVRMSATANIEWREGMTYADLPAIDGHDLFTAAQVLAMGRVPPGWTAMPPEMDVSMYAAMGFWSQEGTLAACKAHASDRADTYRRLLAAAPRPPAAPATAGAGGATAGAAQEVLQLRKAAQEALELLEYVKRFPKDAGFIDWQAGVVEQQLRSAINDPAAHGIKEGGSNAG